MQKDDHPRLRVLTAVGALTVTLTLSSLVRFGPQARGLVESFIRSH